MAVLVFKQRDPIPRISIIVGQAQLTDYLFSLWKADGTDPRAAGTGVNTDETEDVFPLTRTQAEFERTDGDVVDATIRFKSPGPGTKRYAFDVEITQDGVLIDRWKESGEMTTSTLTKRRVWTVKLV